MNTRNGQAILDEHSFKIIAEVTRRECGLALSVEKLMMVQSRLRKRVRLLELPDFKAYSTLLEREEGVEERRAMISALTTNVSHFFREPHHFELMSKLYLPTFRARAKAGERIRIWSAGCSNGQEPYSIAMHLLDQEPALADADFRILATDIDPQVVGFAQTGRYPENMMTGVPIALRDKFFRKCAEGFEARPAIKEKISFRELNLISPWPMKNQFDLIFCRNVVIYFDLETQDRLWPRFYNALADGGALFLGHSERISKQLDLGVTSIGPTAYMKTPSNKSAAVPASGGKNGTS